MNNPSQLSYAVIYRRGLPISVGKIVKINKRDNLDMLYLDPDFFLPNLESINAPNMPWVVNTTDKIYGYDLVTQEDAEALIAMYVLRG